MAGSGLIPGITSRALPGVILYTQYPEHSQVYPRTKKRKGKKSRVDINSMENNLGLMYYTHPHRLCGLGKPWDMWSFGFLTGEMRKVIKSSSAGFLKTK